MKMIEEKADEYIRKMDCSEWTDVEDYARNGYRQGATDEHEELTRWNSPDNPPENDTPVLLKAIWKAGSLIYYRVGRYRCGEYINDSCPSHNIDVIGWREIHE